MRFGRLRTDNVHGSELNALLMPAFAEYQKKTTRVIPVVVLERLGS